MESKGARYRGGLSQVQRLPAQPLGVGETARYQRPSGTEQQSEPAMRGLAAVLRDLGKRVEAARRRLAISGFEVRIAPVQVKHALERRVSQLACEDNGLVEVCQALGQCRRRPDRVDAVSKNACQRRAVAQSPRHGQRIVAQTVAVAPIALGQRELEPQCSHRASAEDTVGGREQLEPRARIAVLPRRRSRRR